jgi:hypothetical protein
MKQTAFNGEMDDIMFNRSRQVVILSDDTLRVSKDGK